MMSTPPRPSTASRLAPRWRVPLCVALLCSLLLSACGMRGPLYLPPPEPATDTEKSEGK